ncbi:MAG: restriction endonuclease [Labilithrix sp.]
MATKTGKPYERLTRRVFETLLAQQSVKNLRVEHDIKLQGLTNEHQIDVYWEFEAGGITYRTVVECKDKTKPVEKQTLHALWTTLQDLPGQPRGVVVSRSGFQEGAERFAKAHGILLYELRAPRDEDWNGFITTVSIKGELLVPKVHGINFMVDEDWVSTELKRCGIASLEELPHVQGVAGAMVIEREDGSALTTVGDVIEAHLCPDGRGAPEWREHLFAEPAYIASELPNVRRIRLRGLRASVELVVGFTKNIEIKLEPLVGLILKEVTGGTFEMFDAEGKPLEPGDRRPARIIAADGEPDPESGRTDRRK